MSGVRIVEVFQDPEPTYLQMMSHLRDQLGVPDGIGFAATVEWLKRRIEVADDKLLAVAAANNGFWNDKIPGDAALCDIARALGEPFSTNGQPEEADGDR